MKKLLQRLFRKPVIWLANKVSSSPQRKAIFSSLSDLYNAIVQGKEDRGIIVPLNMEKGRFIIFSDQHKGNKDAADDFMAAEINYIAALQHYNKNGFSYINLGDCEELWECTPAEAIKSNKLSLLEEARFEEQGRYFRIYGNHDLEWKYLIQQNLYLKPVLGKNLKVHEGLVLQTTYNSKPYHLFFTHGHQGDSKSDGNAFSMWFVAAIWTPVQRYLQISVNTVSDSFDLVDAHNTLMYEWSATLRNMLFISGHTHKPVFASMDHIDRLSKQLLKAKAAQNATLEANLVKELERRSAEYAGKTIIRRMAHPTYFNTGCCCFADGDISGIEIEDGMIRLVKWKKNPECCVRIVLEESPLGYVFDNLI
ncbi:MAG: metallophosphoesterase [Chitinophagaceae bacterium]|nr:metallophosphoesterase [Chitinophagaceae bacterium]